MQYHSAGLTDVGQRRKLNEDAFLIDDDLGLYVVADGMGGHAAGEIASQQAVDTVHGMVIRGHGALDKIAQGDTSEDSLRQAIRVVESAVQDDRGKLIATSTRASYVGVDRFVGLRTAPKDKAFCQYMI